jgi:hypothetical protein
MRHPHCFRPEGESGRLKSDKVLAQFDFAKKQGSNVASKRANSLLQAIMHGGNASLQTSGSTTLLVSESGLA